MAVYVDTAKHPYRGMKMCHMWADSTEELLVMADRIGVHRKWMQKPPKASWIHFDICKTKRALAVKFGAIESDKYAALEHASLEAGNYDMLLQICKLRRRAK